MNYLEKVFEILVSIGLALLLIVASGIAGSIDLGVL